MKLYRKFPLAVITLFFVSSPLMAAAQSTAMEDLSAYLKNLGQYFGYDLTQYCPTTGGPCKKADGSSNAGDFKNSLFDQGQGQIYNSQLNLFNSVLGALIPSAGVNGQTGTIISQNMPNASQLNPLAAQTFTNPPYNSSSQQGVSATPLIDQNPFQADPVSQAVLNIIATPSNSFCMSNDGKTPLDNCPFLYREKIMMQAIGPLQGVDDVFSPTYNKQFISQLNSDTLLSPMLYTTTSGNENSTSSSPNQPQNSGLAAQNQAQQAANFIRYVTGSMNPIALLAKPTYQNLAMIASNANNTSPAPVAEMLAAQNTLFTYLFKLRGYAAISSIGISNLYYILSKRLPQEGTATKDNPPSSQALNEFTMATWRINPYPATSNPQQQSWLKQINTGSQASVQKEIAILLAEINYQLYLSRQQQERMLLTQSALLLQTAQINQPDADAVAQNGDSSNKTPAP